MKFKILSLTTLLLLCLFGISSTRAYESEPNGIEEIQSTFNVQFSPSNGVSDCNNYAQTRLELSLRANGELRTYADKCSGSFNSNGTYQLAVNGQRIDDWTRTYSAGASRVRLDVDFIESFGYPNRWYEVQGWVGDAHLETGTVSVRTNYSKGSSTPPYSQYTYEVNTTTPQCSPGDREYGALELRPSGDKIEVHVTKCQPNEGFVSSGVAVLWVNGAPYGAYKTYSQGSTLVTFMIDPAREGFASTNWYEYEARIGDDAHLVTGKVQARIKDVSSSPTDIPIIFLPGILGSDLANLPKCSNRPDRTIWPPWGGGGDVWMSEGLPTLYLKDDGVSPANACDNILAPRILDNAQFRDNAQFIQFLRNEGFVVYPFAYDWRLDIQSIADSLDHHVNYIRNQTGANKVTLIGHSMGGLVIREYTTWPNRAQKVERVITVGTPYWGAPVMAYYIRAGKLPIKPLNIFIQDDKLRRLYQNSPGPMQLLPSEAYIQQAGIYFKKDGASLNYQQTNGLFARGDFISSNSVGLNGNLLQDARNLHRQIDNFNQVPPQIPYYILAANNLLTVNEVVESTFVTRQGRYLVWNQNKYVRGDGTVPFRSAALHGSQGYWSGNAQVCGFSEQAIGRIEHANMMSSEGIQVTIWNILSGRPNNHCATRPQQNRLGSEVLDDMIQVALQGSVTLTIIDDDDNIITVDENGIITNTIPNSLHYPSQSGTIALIPAGQRYTVDVRFHDDQPILLQVSEFTPEENEDAITASAAALFMDAPTADGGEANLVLDLTNGLDSLELAVDTNQDGTVDHTLPPTSVLDKARLQDATPPETKITLTGATDEWGFYTGLVTATISATDEGVGVWQTQYSLDGGSTWLVYTDTISFTAEDVPVLEARSTDLGGNPEFPWVSERLRPYTLYLPMLQK